MVLQVEDKKVVEALDEMEEQRKWVNEHYDELREKYEGKVFAVKDKKVIITSGSITELLEEAKKIGEDPTLLFVDSIPPKGVSFIL